MFQIPIKYIENNLVLNNDKECFAYYEMIPYNYSFLSADQKNQIHDEFRQLVAANKNGRMHFNRTQLTIYQNEAYIHWYKPPKRQTSRCSMFSDKTGF